MTGEDPQLRRSEARNVVQDLLERHGTTYAEECGIELRDEPAPLFQLLVMTVLMSKRIGVAQAVKATRAVLDAGWTTPERLAASSASRRVAVLNRNGYARYDISTSRTLGEVVAQVRSEYGGDLRRLRAGAEGDGVELQRRLQQFTGIGPVGADIFLREVQAVWLEVRPFVDRRAHASAQDLGLPTDPEQLAGLVPDDDLPRLVAALVRASFASRRRGCD